jgi:hypothetical protein
VVKGNSVEVRSSVKLLAPRGREIAIQGGGRGKRRGKGRALRLGHQVNN